MRCLLHDVVLFWFAHESIVFGVICQHKEEHDDPNDTDDSVWVEYRRPAGGWAKISANGKRYRRAHKDAWDDESNDSSSLVQRTPVHPNWSYTWKIETLKMFKFWQTNQLKFTWSILITWAKPTNARQSSNAIMFHLAAKGNNKVAMLLRPMEKEVTETPPNFDAKYPPSKIDAK